MERLAPKPVPRPWAGGFWGPGVGEVWLAEEPLLVKLLDPGDWLSLQVHPSDREAQALEGPGARGKEEAWYVLSPGPVLLGFKRKTTPEEVRALSQAGGLEALLNRVQVAPGQVLWIPAGTVHALGPGVRVYEVQTPSHLTYRLYDYGRPRALHLEKALRVLNLEASPPAFLTPEALPGGAAYRTPRFSLYRFPLAGEVWVEGPLLLTLVEGEARLATGEGLRPPATLRLGPGERLGLFGEGLLLGAWGPA